MIPMFILRQLMIVSILLAAIFITDRSITHAAGWESAQIPSITDQDASEGQKNSSITDWYRCWVKVPDSYFSKHERNLFEESVGIHFKDLMGSHEVWVNGVEIGEGSSIIPQEKGNKNGIYRHKVPVGTLKKGLWNELAIRFHNPSAVKGFKGEAPFIMDYFLECIFEGEWEIQRDDGYLPGKALAIQPQRATFETFRESQRVLGRAKQVHGPILSPSESASRMHANEGLKTGLILHEPTIAQPFHFSFDEHGRLWVTQSRQYPYPAGIRMLSRDKYYRAHYNKIPPAPPHHEPGADRISFHEDTNGDGIFDKHKIFVEGLNMANAALRGHGGVWVMHTPYLLFYPDADNNDIPDGPPEVKLAGFGFEDTHSIANGLTWGPDGWLYGGQGSTCSCRVTRPGIDPPNAPGVYFEGCMVWRYHPDTQAFELFAEGGGNTYGLEFDAQGRLYSGHNGGNTRGWHFVQGGFYQMQGVNPGKFGPPRNPYAFGELPMMRTLDKVVRFTHFGAFVEGTAMPPALHGMLLAIDPLHNEVIAAQREKKGATFTTHDHGIAVKSFDSAFRPVYIANAPDGSIFVSDMYEYYIAHGQHYQNQIDPTSGRIYRISGVDSPLESDLDLANKTTTELVTFLAHPNKWHRQTAVRLIGEREDPHAFPSLKQFIISEPDIGALNALWALYQSGGFDTAAAIHALNHPFPPVRMWTTRLLGDSYGIHRNLGLAGEQIGARSLPEELFETLIDQAKVEPDAEVRSQMASTARRLSRMQGFDLVEILIRHAEDLEDPYIPLLCWWVFEAHFPFATEAVVSFLEEAEFWNEPLFLEHILPRIARRLAVDGKRKDLLLLARLMHHTPSPHARSAMIGGFEQAFRGRSITGLPDRLINELNVTGSTSILIRIRQGDSNAIKQAVSTMVNEEASLEDRLPYVRAFGELKHAIARDALLELAMSRSDLSLRKAAFASLNLYDDPKIVDQVLKALPQFPADLRSSAFTLLLAREPWTRKLLETLHSGGLQTGLIPPDIAENLRLHRNPSIQKLATQFFTEATPVSAPEFPDKITALETILKTGSGSPYVGEPIFMERCAACHKLFFKGGAIGPDLTSYQRNDLGTMLLSIVNPNAEIREGFQFINIETTDGRSLGGFELDRDHQVTVLRGLDGQDLTVAAHEIADVQPMGRSMMPEGLLDDLSDQQLRDLFAYLRISQPIRR